jgi:cell division protease FtsH
VPFYAIRGSILWNCLSAWRQPRARPVGTAKKHAPAIVFIDVIEAVGRQRGAGLAAAMTWGATIQPVPRVDGFAPHESINVIGRPPPGYSGPALLLPGRFDRQIPVHLPDIKGREAV